MTVDDVKAIAAERIKELEAFLQLSPWDGYTKFAQQMARDTLIITNGILLSGNVQATHTAVSTRSMTTETKDLSVYKTTNTNYTGNKL